MTVQVGVSNSDLPYLYLLAWLLAVIPSCNHFRGIPASLYSRYPKRILKGTIHFVMAQVNLISSTLHNMYIYIYIHIHMRTYVHMIFSAICTCMRVYIQYIGVHTYAYRSVQIHLLISMRRTTYPLSLACFRCRSLCWSGPATPGDTGRRHAVQTCSGPIII